jgi:L-ascorbate metabolism protein UlaG (beta-lactamase superfamily)
VSVHRPGLVTWLGHASTEIEMDGVRMLTDPVLRPRIAHLRRQVPAPGPGRGSPDAVLISHHHFDHLDLPTLKRFGRDVRIIGPRGSRRMLGRKGFTEVEELAVGDRTGVGQVAVTAVPAEHDGRRWPFARDSEAVGFLLEGSRTVYFAGDTDVYDEMAIHLPGVDLALLPVWGWGHTLGPGHMDPERAARAAGIISPRLAVPIHWGTLFPLGMGRWGARYLERPPQEFAEILRDYSPETEVRVLPPGASTELPDAGGSD